MPAKSVVISKHVGAGKQRGALLLIMLVVLVMGIAAALVYSLTSSSVKTARQEKTANALAQAKEALIGFAVTYAENHTASVDGYLPCPDTDGNNGLQPEGVGEYGTSSCNSNPATNQDVSVIGRLPWKTLDLSAFRDGDGECLWYAVSGTYKNNPPTGLMNWDTNGQFQVYAADGTLLASQVVAVIFAPGPALSGQDRSGTTAPICGGNYTVTNYLENDTVHNINNTDLPAGNFIKAHEHRDANGNITLTVNDQLVYITRQDIWNAIVKRADFQQTNSNNPLYLLTRKVAECYAYFGQHNTAGTGGNWWNHNWSLPMPTLMAFATGADYATLANYTDVNSFTYGYFGRAPYYVNDSISSSGNTLGSSILTTTNCSAWTNSLTPWYNNWKDHLFYAVSREFRPSGNLSQSCGSYDCISVNGADYAGVVLFANSRTGSQVRDSATTSANRGDPLNYLESNNAANYQDTNGNNEYKTHTTPGVNDVLYCIREDLSVLQCP